MTAAIEILCSSCGRKIAAGETFTSLTVAREKEVNDEIDVLHGEYVSTLCSSCSNYRSPSEGPVSTADHTRYVTHDKGRQAVINLLRRTAAELEKGEFCMIKGLVVGVAGHPIMFKNPGALTCAHVLRVASGVPSELYEAITSLQKDLVQLDVNAEKIKAQKATKKP